VKTPLLIITATLFCILTSTAEAQNLKIGFVNSQKIFDELPEAQKVKKDLEEKLQLWRDTMEIMSRDFQQQVEAYQKQQGTMLEAAKQTKLQELQRVERQLREYEASKQSEAAALQSRVTNPLKDKILRAIEDIAKREKLNFIFDRAQEPVMLLLYADTKYDYTNLVIDHLKRSSN